MLTYDIGENVKFAWTAVVFDVREHFNIPVKGKERNTFFCILLIVTEFYSKYKLLFKKQVSWKYAIIGNVLFHWFSVNCKTQGATIV